MSLPRPHPSDESMHTSDYVFLDKVQASTLLLSGNALRVTPRHDRPPTGFKAHGAWQHTPPKGDAEHLGVALFISRERNPNE